MNCGLFEVREAEGRKGLGCFALQDVPAGHLLIAEEPLLTLPRSHPKRLVGERPRLWCRKPRFLCCYVSAGRTIEKLASQLQAQAKEDYFSLSGSHVDYQGAENIWYTNSLEMGDSEDRIGIFLIISRFNHSCNWSLWFLCQSIGACRS